MVVPLLVLIIPVMITSTLILLSCVTCYKSTKIGNNSKEQKSNNRVDRESQVNVNLDEDVVSPKRQETCAISITYQIENNSEETNSSEAIHRFADNATQTSWSYTDSSSSEWEKDTNYDDTETDDGDHQNGHGKDLFHLHKKFSSTVDSIAVSEALNLNNIGENNIDETVVYSAHNCKERTATTDPQVISIYERTNTELSFSVLSERDNVDRNLQIKAFGNHIHGERRFNSLPFFNFEEELCQGNSRPRTNLSNRNRPTSRYGRLYNSPYALTSKQKQLLQRKKKEDDKRRQQLDRQLQHELELRKLENEEAFERWKEQKGIKHKRKRRDFQRTANHIFLFYRW